MNNSSCSYLKASPDSGWHFLCLLTDWALEILLFPSCIISLFLTAEPFPLSFNHAVVFPIKRSLKIEQQQKALNLYHPQATAPFVAFLYNKLLEWMVYAQSPVQIPIFFILCWSTSIKFLSPTLHRNRSCHYLLMIWNFPRLLNYYFYYWAIVLFHFLNHRHLS